MIECQDILALCDRFEVYLTPLDITILRLRYNGDTLMLPKAVGERLHISDERVRQLEERALGDLRTASTWRPTARTSRPPAWPSRSGSRSPTRSAAGVTGS